MNKVGLKQKSILIITALLLASVPAAAIAANPSKAYFKSFGADVMAGGWFADASGNCSTSPSSNYQDGSFTDSAAGISANSRTGGILTYALEDGSGNSKGGASSQYGAFSTGIVEGADASQYGFYSDGVGAAAGATAKNKLTFANNDNTVPWGGNFEGSVRQSNCIPDYYDKKPSSTGSAADLNGAISQGSNAYYANVGSGSVFTLTADGSNTVVPAGDHITFYVNGNVYIGGNITYASHSVDTVPKFAVVAKGSIYIGANVTELDGVYVAQPSTNNSQTIVSDEGNIWTCHDNTTNPVLYSYPAFVSSCAAKKLTVNGALIAKEIIFMRLMGDVNSASTSEDSIGNANSSGNIGEVINYTPDMVIGGGFFNQTPSNNLPVDSLISLPPVF